MAMEIEETACYYCPWATDHLQTCINHVVEAHNERLLKVKTAVLDEQSGIRGMKTKNFGIIPNEMTSHILRINELLSLRGRIHPWLGI